MIEVKIQRGEEKVIFEVNEPLGKHQREWFNKYAATQEKPTSETINAFLDFRDKLILELSKTKIDKKALDEMPLVEKNRIIDAIEKRFKLINEGKDGKDFTVS